jgi:hypothetical protein
MKLKSLRRILKVLGVIILLCAGKSSDAVLVAYEGFDYQVLDYRGLEYSDPSLTFTRTGHPADWLSMSTADISALLPGVGDSKIRLGSKTKDARLSPDSLNGLATPASGTTWICFVGHMQTRISLETKRSEKRANHPGLSAGWSVK